MQPLDDSVMNFIKDWLWAPLLALVGWAWHRNEQEHDDLWKAHDKLKEQSSEGHSKLNDKLMEHVDLRFEASLQMMRDGDLRNSDHIAKIYDKLEQHGQRSEDRHRELMLALHTGLSAKADK